MLFVSSLVGLAWSVSCRIGNRPTCRFWQACSAWTSHQTMTGFIISDLSQSELVKDRRSDFRI